MRPALLALALSCVAAPVAAQGIALSLPIDCDLGRDCFIQQYKDRDPGDDARDYTCNGLSYDGHSGTDFALPTRREIARDVQVIAAAPGTVINIRDGMRDRVYRPENGGRGGNRACGNGVLIDHGGGWETQYCHLKRGSLRVEPGQAVARGAVLGTVGISGRAEFPHVHLTVRKNGEAIDPFRPSDAQSCGGPAKRTLWQTTPPYRPGGLIDVGSAANIPEYDAVRAGTATQATLQPDADAIVVFGFAFGGRPGDQIRIEISGPGGVLTDQTLPVDRKQAQFFRAAGLRRSTPAWPEGRYVGTVTFIRDGKGIERQTTGFRVAQ